jgi:hypothetical protein
VFFVYGFIAWQKMGGSEVAKVDGIVALWCYNSSLKTLAQSVIFTVTLPFQHGLSHPHCLRPILYAEVFK